MAPLSINWFTSLPGLPALDRPDVYVGLGCALVRFRFGASHGTRGCRSEAVSWTERVARGLLAWNETRS